MKFALTPLLLCLTILSCSNKNILAGKSQTAQGDANLKNDEGFVLAHVQKKSSDCPVILKINEERYWVTNDKFSKDLEEGRELLIRFSASKKMNQCNAQPIILSAIKFPE